MSNAGEGAAGFFSRPRHPFVMVRIVRSRDDVRRRIRERVARMTAAGLEEEARWVFAHRESLSRTPLQAVGYKEFFPFFQGEERWDESVEKLCLATNRLVRSQDTWFRKFPAEEVLLEPDSEVDAVAERLAETVFA